MAIYVVGDFHGNTCGEISKLNTKMFIEQRAMNKSDFVIQLGDFGLFWEATQTKQEIYWLNWLTQKKFTFCFIDGNHENFTRLNAEFKECEFQGGIAKYYETQYGKIYWLQRGECYEINGKKILTIGGAQSIDKAYRTEGLSWWKEELLSYKEEQKVIDTCRKHKGNFDYILTHTAPQSIVAELANHLDSQYEKAYDPTSKFFQHLVDTEIKNFKQWHFGHFHIQWGHYNSFFCHYNNTPIEL